jgi:broad specificity phosphatase PhoE
MIVLHLCSPSTGGCKEQSFGDSVIQPKQARKTALPTARLLQMTTRLLVRHCRHADVGERLTGRGEDGGLTQAGQVEAAALAERLAAEPVTHIYSSPRRRARETAAAIADRHGVTVRITDAIDEIDFGPWTGQRFADLDGTPDWDRWNRERASARVPGGESMGEALARARDLIERVDCAGTSVFVTHCDIIRALLCWQDGRAFGALFDYDVPPGSVTEFRLSALEAA